MLYPVVNNVLSDEYDFTTTLSCRARTSRTLCFINRVYYVTSAEAFELTNRSIQRKFKFYLMV